MGNGRWACAAATLLLAAVLLAVVVAGCGPRRTAAGAAVQASSADSSTPNTSSEIVHATATGKRYHRAGCSSLSKSDLPMTRAEAEQRGLTPCKLCKP